MISHRALRDIQRCRIKYGEAWLQYEREVPYLFIPVSSVFLGPLSLSWFTNTCPPVRHLIYLNDVGSRISASSVSFFFFLVQWARGLTSSAHESIKIATASTWQLHLHTTQNNFFIMFAMVQSSAPWSGVPCSDRSTFCFMYNIHQFFESSFRSRVPSSSQTSNIIM